MPKFWMPFFLGQSLLLSTTILNDNIGGTISSLSPQIMKFIMKELQTTPSAYVATHQLFLPQYYSPLSGVINFMSHSNIVAVSYFGFFIM